MYSRQSARSEKPDTLRQAGSETSQRVVVCLRPYTESPGNRESSGEFLFDEIAMEAALSLTETSGGEVIVLSLARENSRGSLTQCLAMGATKAILLDRSSVTGALEARYFAMALKKVGRFNAVICGKELSYTTKENVPWLIASELGLPYIESVSFLAVSQSNPEMLILRRPKDKSSDGIYEYSGQVVVTLLDDEYKPRSPSIIDFIRAREQAIEHWHFDPSRDLIPGGVGLNPPPEALLRFAGVVPKVPKEGLCLNQKCHRPRWNRLCGETRPNCLMRQSFRD